MRGVVLEGKFSFHDVGIDAFKTFENTFVIWPYEDQMFLDTKNMCVCMYEYMYVYLFVCWISVSLHSEASKICKYSKE